MLLTPAAAQPWLGPDSRNRPWPGHGAMMVRRREALAILYTAFGSWLRLGLGALAWALGIGGAVLVGRGVADGGEGSAAPAGIGVLVLGTLLGGAVVATGSAIARAIAGWWTLATAVRADGGRVDATPDPDTTRAHEQAVAADRSTGKAEMWRLPLLPRTIASLLLAVAGVVLVVQAVQGWGEASTPYAGDDLRGAWLARVIAAAVCLLTAALTASGLRRVHRARMHHVGHDEPAGAEQGGATLTPAVGSGAIVVGGARPMPGGAAAAPSAVPAPPAAGPTVPPAAAEPAAAFELPVSPAPADDNAGAPVDPPRVRLSDGRELAAGITLIGRAPQPRPDEHVDAVVAVSDERVSKNHLTVRVEPGGVVVLDRGSTNGTHVHDPHGGSRALVAGEPHELSEGDVVVLGGTSLTFGGGHDDVEHTVLRSPHGQG